MVGSVSTSVVGQRGSAVDPSGHVSRSFFPSAQGGGDMSYVVANEEYESGRQYVTLARMLQPASDATRGEAHFLAVGASGANHPIGQRFWSRYFWRTRMATPEDAVVGKVVFVLDQTGDDAVHRPPTSRDEALQSAWFMGTVTDLSEMYKQQVQVGDAKVNVNALRVRQ
jgi:hypothetical protein